MRTVVKLQSEPRWAPGWLTRHRPAIARTGPRIVVAACCLLMGWAIWVWHLNLVRAISDRMLLPVQKDFAQAFAKDWRTPPTIPPITRGDEAQVQALLGSELSVEAIFDRRTGALWTREGNHLVRGENSPRGGFYVAIVSSLMGMSRGSSTPDEGDDPDFGWIFRVAMATPDYILVKRLEPGGPELEQILLRVLGPSPKIRINLHHLKPELRPGHAPNPGRDTATQASLRCTGRERWQSAYWAKNDSPYWIWTVVPGNELRSTMQWELAKGMVIRLLLLSLGGVILLIVLQLRRRSLRYAALQKDRLDSLIHNLKTPLTVLKSWCGAIRHKGLTRDEMDHILIEMDEQVDQLVRLIDGSLRLAYSTKGDAPVGLSSRPWLEETGSTFAEICSAAGREFTQDHIDAIARVNLASLQQVLQTLFDNALAHGQGSISFSSNRVGRRLRLVVQDQGPGLSADQLKKLGTPFLRFRRAGTEGFESQGMGLGLSLALQIAEKEGWGLRFATGPGIGLRVEIDLHALQGRADQATEGSPEH